MFKKISKIMLNHLKICLGVVIPAGWLSKVVKRVAIGAGSPGFDSQAGQIGRVVTNSSLRLRRFFGDVLPKP